MSVSAATHYGGSASAHSMVADRTLVPGSSRLQVLNPDAGRTVNMPDARKLKPGRSFTIVNVSANSLDLDDAGGTLVKALAATKGAICHLIENATAAGRWGIAIRSIL